VQAGDTGTGGSSQLSDMHARWSEKGAHEFVPLSLGLGSEPPLSLTAGGRGAARPPVGGMEMVRPAPVGARGPMSTKGRGYPPMHSSHMGGAWGGPSMANGMRMPMPWGSMANGGPPPDAQWSLAGAGSGMGPTSGHAFGHGYGATSPHSQGNSMHLPTQHLPNNDAAAPSKPNTIVLAWNLSPSYTREKLENDLSEIDFHPKKCKDLLEGAFVLWFAEVWHADALIVSLDDTEEHLSPCQGERLRLARWGNDSVTWGSKEVPAALQHVLPKVLQAELSPLQNGGQGLERKE